MSQYPYPGLRPFNIEENDIFFGREQQVDDLLERLSELRFLAVTGNSGCGKSSLIYAGLIPAIKGGLLTTAGLKWRFAIMRPGENPIRNLAEALANAFESDIELDPKFKSPPDLEAWLKEGPLALNEIINSVSLPENTKLLLLVDQFEEIFRYSEKINSDEAEAFVSLLLSTIKYSNPIYIIITMRSDFIGDCSKFIGLPEVINEGQFLTPRLSREQLHEASVEPAELYDTQIEPALVNRILNEMGSDPDQLPLMQHALMYMWIRKNEKSVSDIGSETRPFTLTLDDYEDIGGINNALTNHANEAYNNLNDRQKIIAKTMFQGLAERTNDNLYIRRPLEVKTILSLTDSSLNEITEVINAFRRSSCNFLLPPINTNITEETIIDISHESLIRKWSLLHEWVDREAEYINTYRRLEETATLWEKGDAALYRPPDLNLALRWRDRRAKPEWAQQYGNKYNLVLKFIKESENKYKSEDRNRRRNAFVMGATTAVGVAIIVFLIITLSKYIKQSGDASKRATVMKIQRNLSIAENNSDPVLKDILVFEALDELEELDKGGDLDELTANSNEFYKRINRLIGRSIFQKRDEVLLAGFDDRITGATFNDDDSMIAVSSRDKNNQIRLWKKNDDKWDKHSFNPLDIDKENSEATSNQDFITDIQFNDDGNQLATSSSDGRVKIWDINNSYEIMSLDRKYIITEETINKLKQQNDENKEGKNISEDMIMALEQLASSQQNEIGFVSIDEIVKYANEYRTKINQLGGMTSYITKQSDTRQSDTKQSEYDYVLNQKLRQHVKVIGHEAAITSLDYSSDATKLATAGRDGYLIIWDVSSPNLNNRQIFILKAGHHLNEKYISDLNKKIKDNNSHIILALRKVLADSNSGYVFYSDNELLDKIEDKIGRKLSYNELQLIPRPIGHSNHILDVKFSNDGNVIATSGDDGRIILWDTKTGEIIQVLDRRYIITEDTLINLGNALVNKGSINKEVLSALEQMKSQEQNLSGYSYLEFINTLSENLGGPVSFELEGIIFRDLKVVGHDLSVNSISFNDRDSILVSVGSDSKIIVWKDLEDNPHASAQILYGHSGYVYSTDVYGETKIATSGHDGFIKVWDINRGTTPIITISNIRASLQSEKEPITKVEFSKDGNYLISGSFDRTARIWDIEDEGIEDIVLEYNPKASVIGTTSTLDDVKIMSVDFSPIDSLVAASTSDGHLIIWNLFDLNNPIIKKAHKSNIYEIDFNNDGSALATASWDNKAKVWDLTNIKDKREIPDSEVEVVHNREVYDIAFNNDGTRFATAGWDGSVRIWNIDGTQVAVDYDIDNIKPIYELKDHKDGVFNVEFNKQGSRLLSTGIDRQAIIWSISSDPFQVHNHITLKGDESVYGAKFLDSDGDTRDDLIVTSTRKGTIRIWEKDTGEPIATYTNDGGGIVAKIDSNDGKQIIALSDRSGKITILDYDGHLVDELILSHLDDDIKDIAFNPDGSKLAIALANKIIIKSVGESESFDILDNKVIKDKIIPNLQVNTDMSEFCSKHWRVFEICHPVHLRNRASRALDDQKEDQSEKLLDSALSSHRNNKDLSGKSFKDDIDLYKQIDNQFRNFETTAELKRIKKSKATQLQEAADKLEDADLHAEAEDLRQRADLLHEEARFDSNTEEYYQRKFLSILKRSLLIAHHGEIDKAKENAKELLDAFHEINDIDSAKLILFYINSIGLNTILLKGMTASREGDIDVAIDRYSQAEQLEKEALELARDTATLNNVREIIYAKDYNDLCWWGTMYYRAEDVLFACDKAVEKAGDEYYEMLSKDSRAVAYLLLANNPGNTDKKELYETLAVKDLKEYINYMSTYKIGDQLSLIPIRSGWLTDIENGVNPITPDVIEQLKKEGTQSDYQIQQAY